MIAIRVKEFGAPEVLRAEEVPDLEPKAGQVLVRIAAAGVNPVETYIRSGSYARLPQLPYTPGNDGAGTIERLGKGIRGFRAAERVYVTGSLSGTYAEFCLCTPQQIQPLPETLSFTQGAAIGIPY